MTTVLMLVLTGTLVACRSGGNGTQDAALEKRAGLYEISQIERSWHEASSTQNLDLMMSRWADDATFTVGGQTYAGKAQIRDLFVNQAGPFQPGNHWVSDTPAYKERMSVSGITGTLYFECDYIDVKQGKVVAVVSADQDGRRSTGVG